METVLNTGFLTSQLFWLVVSFACVLFVVLRYVSPALNQALDQRADQIRNDLDDAERLKADAEKLLADYTEKLRQVEIEAAKILEKAEADGVELMARREAEMEEMLKQRLDDADASIALSTEKAKEEMRHYAADLVTLTTAKVISSEFDHDKINTLTDNAIKRLNS